MTEPLYGVWHNSWCPLFFPGEGEQFAATQEQAEEKAVLLRAEYPDAGAYDVVPFDHTREPEASRKKPSSAQIEALRRVARGGLLYMIGCNMSAAKSVLRNEWVVDNISASGFLDWRKRDRLSKVGEELLAKYGDVHGKT